MAKPKSCQHCTKPATIHLTQIVNNQITKFDFCEECPHKEGVAGPDGLGISDILGEIGFNPLAFNIAEDTQLQESSSSAVCSLSGASFEDFKKTGRLGSAESYELFIDKLLPALKNMHRGLRHCGKIPKAYVESHERRTLVETRAQLKQAIAEERFEDAAVLRDTLKKLSSNKESEA